MHKYILLFIAIFALHISSSGQKKPSYIIDVEKYTTQNKSLTYAEVMHYYQQLASADSRLKINNAGETDAGIPLSEIIIDADRNFTPEAARKSGKAVIFINNGIHPGEPDGIDATLWFVQDLLSSTNETLLKKIVFVIIPVYNIDGALVRNNKLRFTQNGPAEYGFRGNGQNLDLNRDFIKCDSRNAQSFTRLFTKWDPDVLIDNHVSDGADYQHVMSLLPTQPDKLGYSQGKYFRDKFIPTLFEDMKKAGFPMTPYVNVWGTTPDDGLPGFIDSPRYASGYSTLFQSFGFVPECHMLKPYGQRVKATRELMRVISNYVFKNKNELLQVRDRARKEIKETTSMPLTWQLNKTMHDSVTFMGYEHDYITSELTGLQRLRYRRDEPYTRKIPFYNYADVQVSVNTPQYYILPQGWYRVIERLQWNGVQMQRFTQDTTINGETYVIDKVESPSRPYEGHFFHYGVEARAIAKKFNIRKGDYIIPLDQRAKRFIVEVLEPQATDSYFTWNYFDAILNRKEGFSDYVFEDMMPDYLAAHPEMKDALADYLKTHPEMKTNAFEQLNYIYTISEFSEPWANQYPVIRVMK